MATNDGLNNQLSGSTGSGAYVGSTSATLITPNIGVATGTSLNLGSSTTINGAIDDDTMATASNSTVATSESIKAYADSISAGGGQILQYVLTSSTSADSTTSTTSSATSITGSITPNSIGNQIIVFCSGYAITDNPSSVDTDDRTSSFEIENTTSASVIMNARDYGRILIASSTADAPSYSAITFFGAELSTDTSSNTYTMLYSSSVSGIRTTVANNLSSGFMLILELQV